MSLRIYNTLSREKESFSPLSQEKVHIYSCGPTPYNFAHIGNLRTYICEDMIIRTLRYLGYRVETMMNVTDIDDKTIRDSQAAGISLRDFTERYTDIFLGDLDRLGIVRADRIVPISTVVDTMVDIIDTLIAKGYAYLADDGSVYYRIERFKNYGRLAHLDREGMRTGVRVSLDEYEKDSLADFALWKAYDPTSDGPNVWEAKLHMDGAERIVRGRPGWHIECSGCNYKYFGAQIDIHMGAIDNIFPHHENEIAQSEAFTGKKFVQYWIHAGHLLVDNKKMAKREKNFFTLRDVIERMEGTPEALVCRGFRLMVLSARHRENFNFTFEKLSEAITVIRSIDATLRKARNSGSEGGVSSGHRMQMQEYIVRYIEYLEDDFDTTGALTVIHETLAYVNGGIDRGHLTAREVLSSLDIFRQYDTVFGIFDWSILESGHVPEEIAHLAAARTDAKNAKDFAKADSLRGEIEALGWRIVDGRDGARVERIDA